MPTPGCVVQFWEHNNFGGRSVTIQGPFQVPNLPAYQWPGGGEMGDDIDALATGPNAWIEVFEDENYEDTVVCIGPNQRVADLDTRGIGDNIDSFKLYDHQPGHW